MHLRQKARRQLGGPHRVILVLQRRLTTFCNPSQLNYLAFFPPIISYYILYTNLSFPHTCRRKNATIPSRTYLELKAVSFLDGSPSHICRKSISETTYILKKRTSVLHPFTACRTADCHIPVGRGGRNVYGLDFPEVHCSIRLHLSAHHYPISGTSAPSGLQRGPADAMHPVFHYQ